MNLFKLHLPMSNTEAKQQEEKRVHEDKFFKLLMAHMEFNRLFDKLGFCHQHLITLGQYVKLESNKNLCRECEDINHRNMYPYLYHR